MGNSLFKRAMHYVLAASVFFNSFSLLVSSAKAETTTPPQQNAQSTQNPVKVFQQSTEDWQKCKPGTLPPQNSNTLKANELDRVFDTQGNVQLILKNRFYCYVRLKLVKKPEYPLQAGWEDGKPQPYSDDKGNTQYSAITTKNSGERTLEQVGTCGSLGKGDNFRVDEKNPVTGEQAAIFVKGGSIDVPNSDSYKKGTPNNCKEVNRRGDPREEYALLNTSSVPTPVVVVPKQPPQNTTTVTIQVPPPQESITIKGGKGDMHFDSCVWDNGEVNEAEIRRLAGVINTYLYQNPDQAVTVTTTGRSDGQGTSARCLLKVKRDAAVKLHINTKGLTAKKANFIITDLRINEIKKLFLAHVEPQYRNRIRFLKRNIAPPKNQMPNKNIRYATVEASGIPLHEKSTPNNNNLQHQSYRPGSGNNIVKLSRYLQGVKGLTAPAIV